MIHLFFNPICWINPQSSSLTLNYPALKFRIPGLSEVTHASLWPFAHPWPLRLAPAARMIGRLTPRAVTTGSWLTGGHHLTEVRTREAERGFPERLQLWISTGTGETGHQSQCLSVSAFSSWPCRSLQDQCRSFKWISGAIKVEWQEVRTPVNLIRSGNIIYKGVYVFDLTARAPICGSDWLAQL